MPLFTIDEEKCTQDGSCIAVCPRVLIEQKGECPVPTPIADAEDLCINCGHCVAVCPQGALSHRSMAPAQCPPVRRTWMPDPDKTEHFLRSRRSIRTYRNKEIKREVLAKLIDMARFAPSGANTQPVQWLVINGSDEIGRFAGMVVDWMRRGINGQADNTLHARKVNRDIKAWDAGEDRVCRGAPHLIITHAPTNERAATSACTIALSYLELAALSLGLGTCWAGDFNAAANHWPSLREALSIPDAHSCFGTMMLGYPKYAYQRLPLRNPARITWR